MLWTRVELSALSLHSRRAGHVPRQLALVERAHLIDDVGASVFERSVILQKVFPLAMESPVVAFGDPVVADDHHVLVGRATFENAATLESATTTTI